jgi:hypothetical protein
MNSFVRGELRLTKLLDRRNEAEREYLRAQREVDCCLAALQILIERAKGRKTREPEKWPEGVGLHLSQLTAHCPEPAAAEPVHRAD